MQRLKFNQQTFQDAIDQAIKVLNQGGMIIYPTDTCYGLGVDATNKAAVAKLLTYKGNRGNKPIAIAVVNMAMASKYVEINETAQTLYSTLLPGAVTVISKSKQAVAAQLIADTGTLGVRIPNYPRLLQLIQTFGKPITTTSANTSGKKPPYSLSELQRYTSQTKLNMVDLFLDAGPLPVRPPSTVVDTTLNEPEILRQGEIKFPGTARVFVSSSAEQTINLGEELMSSKMNILTDKPIIFALQGELGAGKTQLTKGIAKALKIKETVNSPTYTIVKEYQITHPALSYSKRGTLYHIDTWRLHEGEELWQLGLREMLKPEKVIVIEWLQKVKPMLEGLGKKAKVVWVELLTVNETTRKIKVWEA